MRGCNWNEGVRAEGLTPEILEGLTPEILEGLMPARGRHDGEE